MVNILHEFTYAKYPDENISGKLSKFQSMSAYNEAQQSMNMYLWNDVLGTICIVRAKIYKLDWLNIVLQRI